MNAQETYDTVARHLITQGKPSRRTVSCFYRLNELKCAVGVLIPDDLYDPNMEMKTVDQLVDNFPKLEPLLQPNLDLLRELQQTHDNRDIVNEDGEFNTLSLMFRLKLIGEAHKLDTGVLAQ